MKKLLVSLFLVIILFLSSGCRPGSEWYVRELKKQYPHVYVEELTRTGGYIMFNTVSGEFVFCTDIIVGRDGGMYLDDPQILFRNPPCNQDCDWQEAAKFLRTAESGK